LKSHDYGEEKDNPRVIKFMKTSTKNSTKLRQAGTPVKSIPSLSDYPQQW